MLYLKIERNKSGARKDRRSVISHFSAKNIPFENGGFDSIPFHFIPFQKSGARKDRRSVFNHFSAKNIPFKIRKIFRRDIVITLIYNR